MASRDELYAKFGITAEAAQLFETELGTLLLCAEASAQALHLVADTERATAILARVNRSTLGQLLKTVKTYVQFDDDLEGQFSSALAARNRLMHGFFERHNLKTQTDEGRDVMFDDLEALHEELFQAWQRASAMTSALSEAMSDQVAARGGK